MGKKILLLDQYTKIGNEEFLSELAKLGYLIDKLFKSNAEEVMGILKRGKYNALFIHLFNKSVFNIAKAVKIENKEIAIIGILTGEKNKEGDYSFFTEVLSLPINLERVKEILKGALPNE